MKKTLLLLITLITFSCSDDNNCEEERQRIAEYYDSQIAIVKDRDPVDTVQLNLLIEEKQLKMDEVCN